MKGLETKSDLVVKEENSRAEGASVGMRGRESTKEEGTCSGTPLI